MVEEKKKIIMYDSDEAATYKTDIKGWVSSDGFFCGDGKQGEQTARYRGSTHTKCECGNIIKTRSYNKCETCRNKISFENYTKLPFRKYMGEPVVDYDGDEYFFSEEQLVDYLYENDLTEIDLLFCDENNWQEIEPDYWCDCMIEDGELPLELEKAMEALNEVIRNLPAALYSPSKIRTNYKLKKEL